MKGQNAEPPSLVIAASLHRPKLKQFSGARCGRHEVTVVFLSFERLAQQDVPFFTRQSQTLAPLSVTDWALWCTKPIHFISNSDRQQESGFDVLVSDRVHLII
jgi:hypothetical protein